LLSDERYKNVKLFHSTSTKFDKQANACFLMGAFMVVVLKQAPEVIWEAFAPYHSQFKPFRDASYGDTCTYECTIFHCLKGLEFALNLGWYKFREFDNKEYEYYEKVENGDLNWIIPNKFIAFMGPIDTPYG
jgi:cell division cycle 14